MLRLKSDDDKRVGPPANPVLVEFWRGEGVESRHRGAVIVCEAKGGVVFAAGDVATPIFPRSALKPFQALTLIETGAAAHFRLSDAELALACASHRGHAAAVAVADAWLHDLELLETALVCGPQEPADLTAATALIREDRSPRRVYHNCSGKHLGFLTACVHRGWDVAGYAKADHPAQRYWLDVLETLSEQRISDGPQGVDGCGFPAISLTLSGLARAVSAFAAVGRGARQTAFAQLRAAMVARPDLVAGPGAFDTDAITVMEGALVCKMGAEGVRIGALPRRGLAFALKIDDGATRAADAASAALIDQLIGRTDPRAVWFRGVARQPLRNASGETVGAAAPGAVLLETV